MILWHARYFSRHSRTLHEDPEVRQLLHTFRGFQEQDDDLLVPALLKAVDVLPKDVGLNASRDS